MDRRRILALLVGTPLAARIAAAQAPDALQAAKAAGQVGERPDGLAGVVVPGAPASVQELVQQVNAQRLDRYREIARSSGTPLDQVRAVAGAKLIELTPPGWFVMDASGRWVRR